MHVHLQASWRASVAGERSCVSENNDSLNGVLRLNTRTLLLDEMNYLGLLHTILLLRENRLKILFAVRDGDQRVNEKKTEELDARVQISPLWTG